MKHSQGFTLIEALFVIAISSVLAVIATSALHTMQLKMERRSAITLIASSLSDARNSAITRHTPVALCGSRNASVCDSLWQEGILVFLDVKGQGNPASANDILGFYRIETRKASVAWRGFGAGNILRFDRMGRTSASNGSFTYCPGNKDNHYAQQVVINRGGRVRYSRDRNNDGIHEDSSGKPLICP